MLHLPNLISDLAIILVVGAIVTFIFKLINQPIVLGYIIAGFMVSPNVSIIPSVTDGEAIKIWAEIGVIFLLFSLGLEFSFKKLRDVGGPASITGVVEVIFMLVAGYLTGHFLGWNEMDSIFLGGILSISSTTIIIRAFDELGVKTQHFATVVFGVLIVEDLVAILLLVLLSTIAVTQQFHGAQLVSSALKLVFFLCIWFIGGIFIIPSLLQKLKKSLTDELLLIFSLGLCLLMVIFATKVGFSPALGAFVMGSIFAETTEGKRIEHLIQPMKDFFGAIFFVSVGMLIDPNMLMRHWQSALIITVVTIVGKIISSSLGSLISGQTLKNSVQTGFSLAQIGEFSFIIATLGLTLNVTSDFLYPLAVAVSVLTTFATPYLIKYSSPFANMLERILPKTLKIFIQRYNTSTQAVAISNNVQGALRSYLTKFTLLLIVLVAITVLSKEMALKYLHQNFQVKKLATSIAFFGTFIASAPFFWALTRGKLTEKFRQVGTPGLAFLPFVLNCLHYAIVLGILGYQISIFIPTLFTVIGIFALLLLGFSRYSNYLGGVYQWVEKVFLKNFHANTKAPMTLLLPWEAHLSSYVISPNASFIGRTIESLEVREKFGVSIVLIERGNRKIKAPSSKESLFPNDRLSVIGTDEQLLKFKAFLDTANEFIDDSHVTEYGLKGCVLSEQSPFIGKSIRESGIREMTEGLVVGLERSSERIINPQAKIVLKAGDVLWIVGNKDKMKSLN
ncbi:MAG: cation:proton antiporter [Bacteriovoracaceae bacterium]|nr:cation:proton antiporter [Bacteriovoracaceae bacterium]